MVVVGVVVGVVVLGMWVGGVDAVKKVKLEDIQVLTFKRDQMTTGRRLSGIPQLTCKGGEGCGQGAEPVVMQVSPLGSCCMCLVDPYSHSLVTVQECGMGRARCAVGVHGCPGR
jgi:hypothetical protein